MSFQSLLTVTAVLVATAAAFKPSSVEGIWFLQSFQNTTAHYRESTCNTAFLAWYNETEFELEYNYTLTNGENVIDNFIGSLNAPPPKVAFLNILKKIASGELRKLCKVTGLPFSKSENTVKVVSDCYFDAACFTKHQIPTEAESQEIEELCADFTKTDNSKC